MLASVASEFHWAKKFFLRASLHCKQWGLLTLSVSALFDGVVHAAHEQLLWF